SSRRRHTRCLSDWSSDVCSSDLHRADVVNAVGAEKEQRPAAADPCAAKQAITLALFQRNAAHKKQDRREIRNAGFAEGAESSKRSEERRVGKECGCGGRGVRWRN